MATVLQLPISVPPLPSNWSPPSSTSKLAAPAPRTLLPVGPAYLAHVKRVVHNLTFEEQDAHDAAEQKRLAELKGAGANGEDDLGVGEEEESPELLLLDPKEWKKQDHYAVLGLSKFRYRATPAQIKVANRKKVLKHHPDKKASEPGHTSNDDAFFKCIAKAYETLSNPERRRQFDSVDPYYEDFDDPAYNTQQLKTYHAKNEEQQAKEFFKKFTPFFSREARFSKVEPVPGLGKADATKADVEGFYDFWYNFDSWRSFEYQDKEVNEGSDNRDDKRYTEKKNKSERARKKKEDTARLRGVVDLALSLDPRIKRIKHEEKEAREAKKKSGKPGAPAKKTKEEEEAEKKKLEEEKAVAEEADKLAKADAKKAKAAAANAAKKARREQRAKEEAGEGA